jgi:hypothetical protein
MDSDWFPAFPRTSSRTSAWGTRPKSLVSKVSRCQWRGSLIDTLELQGMADKAVVGRGLEALGGQGGKLNKKS